MSDDVTAEWVLDLWTLAPTPAKAARLRETTLARLLRGTGSAGLMPSR